MIVIRSTLGLIVMTSKKKKKEIGLNCWTVITGLLTLFSREWFTMTIVGTLYKLYLLSNGVTPTI